MIALDASALLAFLFREAGHERVESVIETACISTVNLAEVVGRFTRDGHEALDVLRHISSTSIEIVPFTAADAALTAALLPRTHRFGLSLGDRACLSLALARSIPAFTADRAWKHLGVGVEVQVIR